MDKRSLTERDICTKFILPAIKRAGWDAMVQVREEVYFTKGRIIVRGKLVTRGKAKKADFVLYYKPNIPIALIEAKTMRTALATAFSRLSTTPQRSISHSCFPQTATASCFTTARAEAFRSKRILGSTPSRRRPTCGHDITRTISTMAAAKPRAIIR
jgi:hypothetical protein